MPTLALYQSAATVLPVLLVTSIVGARFSGLVHGKTRLARGYLLVFSAFVAINFAVGESAAISALAFGPDAARKASVLSTIALGI